MQQVHGILELVKEISAGRLEVSPLQSILIYILSAAPNIDIRELSQTLEQAFPEEGQALVSTIAEKWLLQGREEGERRGTLLGAIQAFRSLLGDSGVSPESLNLKTIGELTTIANQLQAMLRNRMGKVD